MSMKYPLVERPELQSGRQRTLYGALTLIFWVLWIYLWLPLLALLAWALGVEQAYKYMIVLGGYNDFLRVLGMYGLVILLLGCGLIVWAIYNIVRFGGGESRLTPLAVTDAQIGRHFGQEHAAIAHWQLARCLHVSHDDNGRIACVEIPAAYAHRS